MSTFVRLTIDQEMQKQLNLAKNLFPALKPSQAIRFGFMQYIQQELSKKQPKPTFMTQQESDEMLDEIRNSVSFPEMTNEEFQDWWMENKNELRGVTKSQKVKQA